MLHVRVRGQGEEDYIFAWLDDSWNNIATKLVGMILAPKW